MVVEGVVVSGGGGGPVKASSSSSGVPYIPCKVRTAMTVLPSRTASTTAAAAAVGVAVE